jgi:signal transduction histidine kinase
MKIFRHLSIYYKITGIIVGMLLLLSIIIGVIMIKTTDRLLIYQMERRGAEVASYIAALSSNDIILDDHYALFDRINQTKNNNSDVRYIVITDSAGHVLAHTFSGNLPRGLPVPMTDSQPAPPPFPVLSAADNGSSKLKYQVTRFNSNEGLIREIIVPIENGAIGYVRVGMSEKPTQQMLKKNIDEFFIITLLLCSVAALGATQLAYVIIRPVTVLAKAAKEIQKGNFSMRAFTSSEDEIGHLATMFNEMSDTLQLKQQENDRLLAELRSKETIRTSLMSKLYTIQEDERKRISRELHDETSQSMASLLAYMKVLLSKLTEDRQKNLLLGARDVAVGVLENLRKMAVELRPPVLDDLGITAAMGKYIAGFKAQHHIDVLFSAPSGQIPITNEISLALYRILQESLTNIAKHAHATRVQIDILLENGTVRMLIADNGIGLCPGVLDTARKNNRLGLYGMKERAELLGGNLDFESANRKGTRITVKLPLSLE